MIIKRIERHVMSEIPSASGVEFYNSSFYIVGDNSAWLYVLSDTLQLQKKVQIFHSDSDRSEALPKKVKPDFEATTIVSDRGQDLLLIFGSGSKKRHRNNLVEVNLKSEHIAKFDLTPLYKKLGSPADDSLNIEGAVFWNERLFLLNRATNEIYSFSHHDFKLFLNDVERGLNIHTHKVKLPKHDGHPICFSGAGLIPNTSQLIFSASVEVTSNWIDDGEVLGSYLGLLDLDAPTDQPLFLIPLVENDLPIPVKVESLSVLSSAGSSSMNLVLVSDSDGSHSEFIRAEIAL